VSQMKNKKVMHFGLLLLK